MSKLLPNEAADLTEKGEKHFLEMIMDGDKSKQMLELADVLEKEDQRMLLSKDMLRVLMTRGARDLIVEALRGHAKAG